MAERVRRRTAGAVVAALLGSAALIAIAGCAATALTPFDYGDEAGVRLTGGSIPGGRQRFCGYVLGPYDGVCMRAAGDAFWELAAAQVTLQGPSGVPLTQVAVGGVFGFDNPQAGKSTLSFDLNGDGVDTQVGINVSANDAIRTEVIAGVLPLDATSDKKHSKVSIEAGTTTLFLSNPTARAVVSATVDDLTVATPDLVWVMETQTDARMVPFEVGDGVYVTDKVVVLPRSTQGEVVIWAQLPDKKSNNASISIKAQ